MTRHSSPLLLTPPQGTSLNPHKGWGFWAKAPTAPLPCLAAKQNPCPRPFPLGPYGGDSLRTLVDLPPKKRVRIWDSLDPGTP